MRYFITRSFATWRTNTHVALHVCPIIVTCLALPRDTRVPERINETRLIRPHSDPRGTRKRRRAFRRSLMKSFEGPREALARRRGHQGRSYRRIEESVANGMGNFTYVYARLVDAEVTLLCIQSGKDHRSIPGARRDAQASERGREREGNRASKRGANGRIRYRRLCISPRESIFRVEFAARSSLTATGSDSRSSALRASVSLPLCLRFSPIPLRPFPTFHGVIHR